jgi:K+-transporting ATPase ATPase B chain
LSPFSSVPIKARDAHTILRRNMPYYGVGGLIAPFVGIKLIDIVVAGLGVH